MNNCKQANLRECERSVEITDNLKTLKYKVNFHTKNAISPHTYDIIPHYVVEVVNYIHDIPLMIYEKHFDVLKDAESDFSRNVQNYKTFVES